MSRTKKLPRKKIVNTLSSCIILPTLLFVNPISFAKNTDSNCNTEANINEDSLNFINVTLNNSPSYNCNNLNINIEQQSLEDFDTESIIAIKIKNELYSNEYVNIHLENTSILLKNIGDFDFVGIQAHLEPADYDYEDKIESQFTLKNFKVTIHNSPLSSNINLFDGSHAAFDLDGSLVIKNDHLSTNEPETHLSITNFTLDNSVSTRIKSSISLINQSLESLNITGISLNKADGTHRELSNTIDIQNSLITGSAEITGIKNDLYLPTLVTEAQSNNAHTLVNETFLNKVSLENIHFDYKGITLEGTMSHDSPFNTEQYLVENTLLLDSINLMGENNTIDIKGYDAGGSGYLAKNNNIYSKIVIEDSDFTDFDSLEIRSLDLGMNNFDPITNPIDTFNTYSIVVIKDSVIGKPEEKENPDDNDIVLKANISGIYSEYLSDVIQDGYIESVKANSNIEIVGTNKDIPTQIFGNIYGIHYAQGINITNPDKLPEFNSSIAIKGYVQFVPETEIHAIYVGEEKARQENFDIFTGTTLTFDANPIKIKTLGNFENYRFVIDPNITTPLITAENLSLHSFGAIKSDPDLKVKYSDIRIVGIKSGLPLTIGNKYVLMKATESFYDTSLFESKDGEDWPTDHNQLIPEEYRNYQQVSKNIVQQGISFLYDATVLVDHNNKEVIATIDAANPYATPLNPSHPNPESIPNVTINPALKTLSEAYLSTAMLVARGQDTIVQNVFSGLDHLKPGYRAFGIMKGGYHRYQSGSKIKSKDILAITGITATQENLSFGGFIEAGWGDYDTHNSYQFTGKVKGDGKNSYFGVGALAKYSFENNIYVDGSIRLGKTRNKFDTYDIINTDIDEHAKFNLRSNYYGVHARIGKVVMLNAQDHLDFSATYLYTHIKGKPADITGDPIHFKGIQSNRVQLKALWQRQLDEASSVNAGLGYEYEFNGKAKATTWYDYDIDAPKLKGSSAIFNIGYTIQPESNHRMTIDIGAEGYLGKRRGASAKFKLTYDF